MQPRSLLRLRQGDLDRLRPARRRGPRERPDGAAVHLPLTRTPRRAVPKPLSHVMRQRPRHNGRRLLAGTAAAPVLFLVYVTLGGGVGGGATWLAVVGLVAAVGGAVLADFVPRAGQTVRDAVGKVTAAQQQALGGLGGALGGGLGGLLG